MQFPSMTFPQVPACRPMPTILVVSIPTVFLTADPIYPEPVPIAPSPKSFTAGFDIRQTLRLCRINSKHRHHFQYALHPFVLSSFYFALSPSSHSTVDVIFIRPISSGTASVYYTKCHGRRDLTKSMCLWQSWHVSRTMCSHRWSLGRVPLGNWFGLNLASLKFVSKGCHSCETSGYA
jgi:hypothetical protein